MARVVTIRIINDQTDVPSPSPDMAQAEKASQPVPSPANPKGSSNKEDDSMKVIRTYIGNRIYHMVEAEARHVTGKYFAAAEEYSMQAFYDNASSTISFFKDSHDAVLSAGKVLAKAGMSASAATGVGIAFVVAAKAIQTFNQYANEAQKLIESSYGNYFYGTRAGFVTGGHGTEN